MRKTDDCVEGETDVHPAPGSTLEQMTGTRWVGVTFFKRLPKDWKGVPREPMRFCEAVCRARGGCIDLLPETISCEGAKRAFGWALSRNRALVVHLSEKTGMSEDRAEELVRQVPVLGDSCAGIRVGDVARPDVLITYVRPETAMRIVRSWEIATSHGLQADISSIMAVCGNAVVKAYTSQSISISFGCPDSRQYGGIQPEEMVVAVPVGLLSRLTGVGKSESARSQ
jgi:uncharacterized protein (DUF169 family)